MSLQVRRGSWFEDIKIKILSAPTEPRTATEKTLLFVFFFEELDFEWITPTESSASEKEKTLIFMTPKTLAFKNNKAWLMLYTVAIFYTHITIKHNETEGKEIMETKKTGNAGLAFAYLFQLVQLGL